MRGFFSLGSPEFSPTRYRIIFGGLQHVQGNTGRRMRLQARREIARTTFKASFLPARRDLQTEVNLLATHETLGLPFLPAHCCSCSASPAFQTPIRWCIPIDQQPRDQRPRGPAGACVAAQQTNMVRWEEPKTVEMAKGQYFQPFSPCFQTFSRQLQCCWLVQPTSSPGRHRLSPAVVLPLAPNTEKATCYPFTR